jgi:1-acyl-sn-glycerol-3-phosphate acyltransferase
MKYILGGLSFAWKVHIGLMFSITLLFFYPILLFFIYKSNLKHYTFNVNIIWSRIMRMLCLYAVEVRGKETTSLEIPTVFCANHTSYLDIFLMYSAFPEYKFLFMGKSEILSYPLVKTFFKNLNIPVFRKDKLKAAKSLIRARKELSHGWSIVIFPEGGIPDNNPKLAPFKEGAFKLAKSAACSITPITFINNYALFSDPEFIFGPACPGLARITIHEIITKDEVALLSELEISKIAFERINSAIR